MIFASLYVLLRLHVDLVRIQSRSAAEVVLGLVLLRHEVAMLRRQVERPQLGPIDRLIFAAIGRHLPIDRLRFSPATLLRWHRELVRRHWAAFGKRPRRPGRPPLPAETQALILRLARDNPRWGYLRIRGELLKLGFQVSAWPIRRLLRRHQLGPAPRRVGPTWRQFLRAHAGAILACDFLTVDTVLLGTLHVLVFIEPRSRIVVGSACSAHPNSAWVSQQARNLAWGLEEMAVRPTLVIHDRDGKFSDEFDAALRAQGFDVVLTPFRSPRANAVCERVLGSLRRECLDWLIVLGERHLMGILREYFDHYNRFRPHRALELQPPRPDPCPVVGEIVCTQRLHGLINEYSRAA